jgi:hypothetical protein
MVVVLTTFSPLLIPPKGGKNTAITIDPIGDYECFLPHGGDARQLAGRGGLLLGPMPC